MHTGSGLPWIFRELETSPHCMANDCSDGFPSGTESDR